MKILTVMLLLLNVLWAEDDDIIKQIRDAKEVVKELKKEFRSDFDQNNKLIKENFELITSDEPSLSDIMKVLLNQNLIINESRILINLNDIESKLSYYEEYYFDYTMSQLDKDLRKLNKGIMDSHTNMLMELMLLVKDLEKDKDVEVKDLNKELEVVKNLSAKLEERLDDLKKGRGVIPNAPKIKQTIDELLNMKAIGKDTF